MKDICPLVMLNPKTMLNRYNLLNKYNISINELSTRILSETDVFEVFSIGLLHLKGTNVYYNLYICEWTHGSPHPTGRLTFEQYFDLIMADIKIKEQIKMNIIFNLAYLRKL